MECLRVIVSGAMNPVPDGACDDGPMTVMVCDVSRAYFHAPATRSVQVEIVDYDFE